MSSTIIATQLAVDPALVQDANYKFDRADRRYIDDQILAIEKLMVDTLITGRHGSYYDLAGSSAALIPGDCVCLASTATGTVTKALTTPLANAGSAVLGVAILAASPGGKCFIAFGGTVPPSITGLLSGFPGFANVNPATGRLVYSATASANTVGTVDNAGWLQVSVRVTTGGAAAAAGNEYRTARIASTANLALSGLAAIDGVTPVANDRVAALGQTSGSQNGIYVASAGAWSYATDWAAGMVLPAVRIGISEGTVYGGAVFRATTPGPYIIGTTAIAFDSNTNTGSALFGANGATITVGTGVPATTPPNGSIFLRTDGTGATTAIYARQAGVWVAIGAGGSTSPAGATNEVQINNAGAFGAATNVKAGTSYVSIGAAVAATGNARFANGAFLKFRNAANSADLTFLGTSSDSIFLGMGSGYAEQSDFLYAYTTNGMSLGTGAGTTKLTIGTSTTTTASPILGLSSPFAMNGHSSIAMTDAAFTVAAADYSNASNVFTGTLTAARTVTYPTSTDAAAYFKWVQNSTTGGFNITVGMGTGTTVAIGAGGAPRLIRFNGGGATLLV